MRKLFTVLACTALTVLLAGNLWAQDLQGRVAVTGRIGAMIPADGTADVPAGKVIIDTDAGFVGGGGVLFGVNEEIAIEMDVTHASFGTSAWGDVDLTTLAFSAQYRLPERNQIVPYLGGGVDVLMPDISDGSADTVMGVHLAAGLDFFLNRQLAINVEVKGTEGFESDLRANDGRKIGNFDPTNLSTTVGARFFFN
ncbi:porin family protein [Geomonas sp. RF6]|uniref:outer membrane beta-barrel protein n=1 Tax=Geomonas sp. RF6 TaxID=2897342 RepID=UPI001E5CC8E8|nr:outer membrane beta-barrel protein [Geomonas sp. RF6]UFS71626.1 porin family protein [Geomonas sp. RF6]